MHLYTSNRAEVLVAQLGEYLRRPSGGPFDDQVVLVQSPGMESWLCQRIAEEVLQDAGPRQTFVAKARRNAMNALFEMEKIEK